MRGWPPRGGLGDADLNVPGADRPPPGPGQDQSRISQHLRWGVGSQAAREKRGSAICCKRSVRQLPWPPGLMPGELVRATSGSGSVHVFTSRNMFLALLVELAPLLRHCEEMLEGG